VGGVSGLRKFCDDSQKELPVGFPTGCLAIAAANPLTRAITKNDGRTFHPMAMLAKSAVVHFLALKGLRPQ
jgi:hypothetical protein